MSMSYKRAGKVLWDTGLSAAGTGAWVPLDNSFHDTFKALYSVSIEGAGDWVQIEGRIESSDRAFVDVQNIVSATPSNLQPLDAPYREIRVVKTGTAGLCRVILFG